jgi:hypothetical protein
MTFSPPKTAGSGHPEVELALGGSATLSNEGHSIVRFGPEGA